MSRARRPRQKRIGGGKSRSQQSSTFSSTNTSKRKSNRSKAKLRAMKYRRKNAVTTAEANKRWKQFPLDQTPEIIKPCPTNTSPIILRSLPKMSPRKDKVPKMKHIQRQTDTLIRIKEDLKYRILLKNASGSKQSRDYFSFAKAFRDIDLNSDGELDRDEFHYACGPKRLNLGLKEKDVSKLFNEFVDEKRDVISMKGFLSGMADLDKPDLDLVSVLSEYKGRALSVLIDRINKSTKKINMPEQQEKLLETHKIPDKFNNMMLSNEDIVARTSQSLPTPQLSPIRTSKSNQNFHHEIKNGKKIKIIRKNGKRRKSLKKSESLLSALLSYKSRQHTQSHGSFIKLPLSNKISIYHENPDSDHFLKKISKSGKSGSPLSGLPFTLPGSPVGSPEGSPMIGSPMIGSPMIGSPMIGSPIGSPTAKLFNSLSQNSQEAVLLSNVSNHSHRGYFSGKRTRNSPSQQTKSINVLQNQKTNMWNSCFSPTSSSLTSTISLPSLSPNTTSSLPEWNCSYEQERSKHNERTKPLLISKRRVGYEHTKQFHQLEKQRNDLFWEREKNRAIGKANTRSIYLKRIYKQQDEERKISESPGTKGCIKCDYAMRTKMGNGNFW